VVTNNVYTDDASALTSANVAPVIAAGPSTTLTIAEDGTPNTTSLTANDANSGDTLTWSILSSATYGTSSVNASTGVTSYAPFHNYNGADSFTVQVADGRGGTDSITVNVTVTSVDDPPLTHAESYDVQYDSWSGVSSTQAFGGYGYRRSTAGRFVFRPQKVFTQVSLITYRGPDQGRAQILVDGLVKATVNLYRATPQWQYPIVISGLSNKQHTITIRALNTHSAPSTGNWVAVDGFKIGATNYDDIAIFADNAFSYDTWATQLEPSTFLNGYKIAVARNAAVRFSFDGVKMFWTTARGPAYGKAEIYIDNVLYRTVDLYRASQQWQYRVAITGLPYGRHNVRIRVLGTSNPASSGTGVVVDYIEIE
jgi:VCBS repeat-containing protein